MTIIDVAPVIATERPFPTCIHWCGWHWAEDTPEEPGCCWAHDIDIPGVVEVMATWDEKRTKTTYTLTDSECHDDCPDRYGQGELREIGDEMYLVTEEPRPPLSITAFRADEPLDEGIAFASLEQAEATAHALLAMVARIRGDEQLAAVHLTAAATAANSPEGQS